VEATRNKPGTFEKPNTSLDNNKGTHVVIKNIIVICNIDLLNSLAKVFTRVLNNIFDLCRLIEMITKFIRENQYAFRQPESEKLKFIA